MPDHEQVKEAVLDELERTRDRLSELMDEDRLMKIRLETERRNQLTLRALALGFSERRVAKAAGVARSYIWKLKRAI